jgi:tetratricopeptide (TPR) repeat protein
MAPEKTEDLTITIRLNDIIQQNRKALFTGLVAVIVILIGFIAGSVIRDKIRSGEIAKMDGYERRFDALRFFIGSEDAEAGDKLAEIDFLMEELAVFQNKSSGFVKARALSLIADIYADQKQWAEAEKAWSDSAKAAANSYLAPISLFNAAVAAEERRNTQAAIDLYNSALAYGDSFAGAVKAQFSIGRLEEGRGNDAGAAEAYRALLAKWPMDPYWANLAQNRLVMLPE